MKKIIKSAFIALGAVLLVFSCSKTDTDSGKENNNQFKDGKAITISATLPDVLTKVTFTPGTDGSGNPKIALTWEDGDQLRVADHDDHSNYSDFDLEDSSIGNKVGEFTGTPVDAESYDVWVIHASVTAAQTQASDGDASHLEYMAQKNGIAKAALSSSIILTDISSVLGIHAKLPAGVATTITSVELTASENIFFSGKTLTINLTDASGAANDELKLYATLPSGSTAIPTGTTLFVRFNSSNASHTVYTAYRELGSGLTFESGCLNNLKLNCVNTDKYAGLDDDGTAEHKYLIADKYQMNSVNGLATGGQTTYFKLIDDINMSGVTFNHINTNSGYTQVVNFDGNNKIISNLGADLFYVFKGSIQNLTLSGSNVGTKRGIFAEYCQGTGHTITNVDITGGSMTGTSANSGALIGRINSGSDGVTTVTITDCDIIDTAVKGGAQTGGLLGSVEVKVVVDNCTVSKSTGTSTVTASGSNSGGLIGQTTAEVIITDCTVSGTNVTGTGVVGGVVGFANSLVTISGSKYTGGTVSASAKFCGGFLGSTGNYASTVTNCQVEDATISTTCTDDPRCSGFVGQLQTNCQVKGCTVGTSSKKVTVSTPQPASGKVLNSGGFVGVNYGTITKNGEVRTKAYVTVTSANTLGQPLQLGGFVGFHRGVIEYCDAEVDMSGLQGQYIGGFAGYAVNNGTTSRYNTVKGSIKGNNYTGGYVGYVDNNSITFTGNQVLSGSVVNGQSAVGGFAGYVPNGTFSDNTVAGTVTVRGSNGGGFVGTTEGGSFTDCSTSASVTGQGTVIGGFVGNGVVAEMTRCFSTGAVVKNSADGNVVGGFGGGVETCTLDGCYFSGSVTTTAVASEMVGGFIGQLKPATGALASIQNCYSTGTVNGSGRWTGGFIGYIFRAADNCGDVEISACYSSCSVSVTGKSYVAGFIGRTYMVAGTSLTIEKCYATGTVTSNQSYASAFIGEIGEATACTISDCYSTGNISGANQIRGGLVAAVHASAASATISRCYSTCSLSDGSFRLGGLIGNINTTECTVEDCAAWNGAVTATAYDYNKNWSSGTIVGTAHPNCHLTNNFRKPGMSVTMWWAPDVDYDHPDVDGTTHPLVIRSNTTPYTYTEASATSLGAPYQFPYHGWHTAETNLSTLAATAKGASSGQGGLGWSSSIWDFTADLPTLI